MRRWTFYLSVALLAFGIGSFVAFEFYVNSAKQNLVVEKAKAVENSSEIEGGKLSANKIDDEVESYNGFNFVCKDEQRRAFLFGFLKERDKETS